MNQLFSRQDAVNNQSESFGYDSLNRLTSIGSRQITYASNGNVTAIGGAGTMTYSNASKPYDMTSFTPAQGISHHAYSVGYTAFDRPSLIYEDTVEASFTYDAGYNRVRMSVNLNTLRGISDKLNANPGFYNFALRSCSSVAARSLTISGAPMIGMHPYLLQAQAYLWSIGIRPWSYCYMVQ